MFIIKKNNKPGKNTHLFDQLDKKKREIPPEIQIKKSFFIRIMYQPTSVRWSWNNQRIWRTIGWNVHHIRQIWLSLNLLNSSIERKFWLENFWDIIKGWQQNPFIKYTLDKVHWNECVLTLLSWPPYPEG